MAEPLKWCVNCRGTHPLSEFYPDKRQPDGKANYCRTSRNLRRNKFYLQHPEAWEKQKASNVHPNRAKQERLRPITAARKLAAQERREVAQQTLQFLRDRGYGPRRIAREVGVNEGSVRRWALGLQTPSQEKLDRVTRLWFLVMEDPALKANRHVPRLSAVERAGNRLRAAADRPDAEIPVWKWVIEPEYTAA